MPNCCNPYGIGHSKKQNRSSTSIVNLERCKTVLPNFPWAEGLYICFACRMRMLKDYKRLQDIKSGVLRAKNAAAKKSTEPGPSTASVEEVPGPSATSVQEDAGPSSASVQEDPSRMEDQAIPGTEEEPVSSPPGPIASTSSVRLYPSLPLEPSSSQQVQARDQAFHYDVMPSAPSDDDGDVQAIDPLLRPLSVLERQLPYNPHQMTPTGSLSSSEATSGSKTSSDSSDKSVAVKRSLDLTKTLQEEVISPVLPSDIRRPRNLRRKLKKWKNRANEAFRRATGIQASPQTRKSRPCVYCIKLFHELCDKFKTLDSKDDKLKCLTSIPNRFSIAEVAARSGCTIYMAKKASALKNTKGAFSCLPPKRGVPMSPENEEIVRKFYQNPENSRASPNETIMMKTGDDDQRRPVAKMRILHNLNDFYQEFKRIHPEIKISISKFCKLRPRNCVWPGLRGHHVTCVCETHQNFEFLLESIECKLTVKEFVRKIVCPAEQGELRPDCYLGMCSECPKFEYLNELFEEVLLHDEISFTQWTRTDATEIKNVTLSVEDFKQKFYEYVPKIIEHEYVTQKQNAYIKHLRDTRVKDGASITVQVDFAQNYSFVVQNAVQGFHWSNRQATIHPFVVHYYDSEKDEVKYKTYCVISDEMAHDADTFHVFRNKVMPQIKEDLKSIPIEKVYYVSDGCAGQYKGIKNFANLFSHKEEYGWDAEWHFCSTSHGKSTCDAISACVKCSARRESLIRGQCITEPHLLFNYCESQLTTPRLCFFYVTKNEVAAERAKLAERYKEFKPIKGTRKHHVFIPKENGVMLMGRTSDSELLTPVDFKSTEKCEFDSSNVKIGSFYSFFEAGKYHAGLLVEQDSEEGDAKFQLLKLNRNTRAASWPDPLVFTDIAYRDILTVLKDPETRDGANYTLHKDDMGSIRTRYNARKLLLTARL